VLDVAKELSDKIPYARKDLFDTFRIFYTLSKHTSVLAETELLFGFPREAKIEYDEIMGKKSRIVIRNTYFTRNRFKAKGFLNDSVLIWSQYDGYLREDEKAFWKEAGIPIMHIYVSGHITQDDLKRFEQVLKPARIIPFHTPDPAKFRELFSDKVMDVQDGLKITL
jgi:hypothetical protein